MSTLEIIRATERLADAQTVANRRCECDGCDRPGIYVDTTAGEIVDADRRAVYAPDDECWLMLSETPGRGVICDDCAE